MPLTSKLDGLIIVITKRLTANRNTNLFSSENTFVLKILIFKKRESHPSSFGRKSDLVVSLRSSYNPMRGNIILQLCRIVRVGKWGLFQKGSSDGCYFKNNEPTITLIHSNATIGDWVIVLNPLNHCYSFLNIESLLPIQGTIIIISMMTHYSIYIDWTSRNANM